MKNEVFNPLSLQRNGNENPVRYYYTATRMAKILKFKTWKT